MKEFKKILFPADLSEVSPKIAPWVLDVAEQFDAAIHLLFVVRRFEHLSGIYVSSLSIETFENELIKGAEIKIEEFAKEYFSKYPELKAKVVVGDAAEEIINYVKSEGIDLVVMGTHGRKGINRIVFGSVAARVVESAPVPVLTVNPFKTKW